MANSFEELIFSRDPDSQNGRKRKCYQFLGILLFAISIFIIPYVISKIEISEVKGEMNEIEAKIKEWKIMDYNDRKSEPVDLTNIRKKVEQLKTDMTVRKINEEKNQKDINDMKKDLEQLKEKKSLGVLPTGTASEEDQIGALKNKSTAFFKYDIIQGTESAFYRFEEKMNFKV